MDPSSSSSVSSVVDESSVSSDIALNSLAEEIVAYEKDNNETHAVKNKFMFISYL